MSYRSPTIQSESKDSPKTIPKTPAESQGKTQPSAGKKIVEEAEDNEVQELGVPVHHGPGFIQRPTIPENYS